MIYKGFHEKRLSALGLGCMRLPTDGCDECVNMEATREMVAYAMQNGVNYFDTAWGYHGGHSETAIGEVLAEYPRESFYLASKFPGYDVANLGRVEEIFEEQLKRCRVDYFDFYLFHNVCELNIDGYLDPQYGIFEYLTEQKKNGRIRHLGFSTHGDFDTMKRFLDAYGEHMEFCQLQINWLDWHFQNAEQKVKMVTERGIPVWVMEPVRGGKLVDLKPEHAAKLNALRPQASLAEWAFRFVQTLPEVAVTLSGMSNLEQVKQNVETYATEASLNGEEMAVLMEIADEMIGKKALPCTACRYCVSHCPQGLDIPWLIELYNEHNYSDGGFLAPMAIGALAEDKRPSACLGCGACEAVCPQNIRISEMMADFTEKLRV